MVATQDTVLGMRVRAMTPATYSRLLVINSPFLWKQPAGSAAVRDYLWIHCETFDEEGAGRADFLWTFERQICPPWLRWRHSRAAWHTRRASVYATAAVQIAELVSVAFADEPAPNAAASGTHTCASLEAQMIDIFAERYRWPPERTRMTPLRQLYQFIRCNDPSDYAPDDAAIIAEDLRRENEEAAALRAAESLPA